MPCDKPSAPEEKFSLDTAAVETRAIRKRTSNRAEPASTLHHHAAYIKKRRGTSRVTKTVCRICNTRAQYSSDRYPRKTASSNNIKVNHQQALDSVNKNARLPVEQQNIQIVLWLQNNQHVSKGYIQSMQNCTVWEEFDRKNIKSNLM